VPQQAQGWGRSTQKQKTELQPLETGAPGEGTAYLKVEKPRFLFLEGSAGAAVAPVFAAAAVPDAPAALAGASAVCAASSTNHPVAGSFAPTAGTCSSTTSAPLCDGGGGFHLSGRGASLSSSSSCSDEFSGVVGGESPCCSRSQYSSLSCFRRSRRWILLSLLRAARSCSHRYAARVTA
jgi:hypothetical protein